MAWQSMLKSNYAFNRIMSTVKSGASYGANTLKKLPRAFMGAGKAAGGFSSMAGWKAGANAVGKGIKRNWQYGTNTQRAGMVGAGVAAGGAGMAAADFLNPWGVGWGD